MAPTGLEILSLKGKVPEEEWAVRVDLAACYRLLVRYGWEDLTFTHITVRVPGAEDQFLEPIIPLIGEDNIIWGADYPHPDCIWPNSRSTLGKNLVGISERVQKKITCENAARLYNIK